MSFRPKSNFTTCHCQLLALFSLQRFLAAYLSLFKLTVLVFQNPKCAIQHIDPEVQQIHLPVRNPDLVNYWGNAKEAANRYLLKLKAGILCPKLYLISRLLDIDLKRGDGADDNGPDGKWSRAGFEPKSAWRPCPVHAPLPLPSELYMAARNFNFSKV